MILAFQFGCAVRRPVPVATPAPKKVVAKYERSQWKHWTDADKNCLDTRAEILKARSLTPVQMNKRGCVVVRGKWQDYYYNEVHTVAGMVDIDHLVPLHHAHYAGGAFWSALQKEKFANDPENLVITNRKYNRQKGPKAIDEWLPVERQYACKYVASWQQLKRKYELKMTASELATIKQLNCKN